MATRSQQGASTRFQMPEVKTNQDPIELSRNGYPVSPERIYPRSSQDAREQTDTNPTPFSGAHSDRSAASSLAQGTRVREQAPVFVRCRPVNIHPEWEQAGAEMRLAW